MFFSLLTPPMVAQAPRATSTAAFSRIFFSRSSSSGRVMEPSMRAMSYSSLSSVMASRQVTGSTREMRSRISSSMLTIWSWQPSQQAKSKMATRGLLIYWMASFIPSTSASRKTGPSWQT